MTNLETKYCLSNICIMILFIGNNMIAISGDLTISGGVTLTVNSYLNGPSPQFTLTCILVDLLPLPLGPEALRLLCGIYHMHDLGGGLLTDRRSIVVSGDLL